MKTVLSLLLIAAFALGTGAANAAAGGEPGRPDVRYEVTVLNLTRDQAFTPFVVVTHSPDISVFTPGQAASEPLEILAEDGDVAPLRDALEASDQVSSVVTGMGLTPAGGSVSFIIEGSSRRDRLSLVAMLVPTNDAFVGLRNAALPRHGNVDYTLYAYDAGSEPNDESCASLPGAPFDECGGPGGGGAPEEGAEGFIHVHSGIHGGGDLEPARRDWKNPVAHVSIRIVR